MQKLHTTTLMLALLTIYFFTCQTTQAQVPRIEWQKALGGSGYDGVECIRCTADGGYIMVGFSDGDFLLNHGVLDVWVVKLGSTGNIQWQKLLGGSASDISPCISLTNDGGYILAGYTYSNDGDLNLNRGSADAWIVKLDNSGSIQWQKTFGGKLSDMANCIQQTADGGYIFSGKSNSSLNNEIIKVAYDYDVWVVKLSNNGNVVWQKTLGGTDEDESNGIIPTNDGGYILVGQTHSNDGDITGNHGGDDAWVVKLDSTGDIQWQKTFGGAQNETAKTIQLTKGGGYILAGHTNSIDGDVSGNHGGDDAWVVKLDSTGNIQWQKTFGGSENELVNSIIATSDAGYVLAGQTNSKDGDITDNKGMSDFWVAKLSDKGMIEWQKTMGGANYDGAFSIQPTVDNSYIVAGQTYSSDGDVTNNHGGDDAWVVKLGAGNLPVTLSNFTATATGSKVQLNWHTATETNTRHFVVASSNYGVTYTTLGKVSAIGSGSNVYTFTDAQPLPNSGQLYYRLKSVDKDGSYAYSPIVKVVFSKFSSGVQMLYPNPANAIVTVKGNQISQVTLTNAVGKQVAVFHFGHANNPFFNISGLPFGVYSVIIQTAAGAIIAERLLVQ